MSETVFDPDAVLASVMAQEEFDTRAEVEAIIAPNRRSGFVMAWDGVMLQTRAFRELNPEERVISEQLTQLLIDVRRELRIDGARERVRSWPRRGSTLPRLEGSDNDEAHRLHETRRRSL